MRDASGCLPWVLQATYVAEDNILELSPQDADGDASVLHPDVRLLSLFECML